MTFFVFYIVSLSNKICTLLYVCRVFEKLVANLYLFMVIYNRM